MRVSRDAVRGVLLTVLGLSILRFDAPPARADSPPDSSTARAPVADPPSDLAPTTAVPWNPTQPVREAETWETVVRFPGQVITFPLQLTGQAAKRISLQIETTNFVPRARYVLETAPRYGLSFSPAALGDRTGFGAKVIVAPPPSAVGQHVRLEYSGSTRNYNSTRADVYLGPVALEYGSDWRPQDRFYGLGLDARESDTTAYAVQREHVRLEVSYPGRRPTQHLPRNYVTAWAGPRSQVLRGGRDPDATPFETGFPALAAEQLDRRDEHFVYGAGVVRDTRVGGPHWTNGYHLTLQAERFDRPLSAFALNSARPPASRFVRTAFRGEIGTSVLRDPRTLRLAVQAVTLHRDHGAPEVAIPDLSTLGGAAGLSGFAPGRFHDLDALALRLTYLFPLASYVELDLHAETGGVYHDLRHDVALDNLENSYGFAVRPRSLFAPIGSFGFDWSREMIRFSFKLGGVD